MNLGHKQSQHVTEKGVTHEFGAQGMETYARNR